MPNYLKLFLKQQEDEMEKLRELYLESLDWETILHPQGKVPKITITINSLRELRRGFNCVSEIVSIGLETLFTVDQLIEKEGNDETFNETNERIRVQITTEQKNVYVSLLKSIYKLYCEIVTEKFSLDLRAFEKGNFPSFIFVNQNR